MKGRSESTGVETTHQTSVRLDHVEQRGDRSFTGMHSFQRQPRSVRLALAIAGLVIAFLVTVFFVSYGSKLYENWRERRLLEKATTLLQEGKLSKAAQMAQDLARRRSKVLRVRPVAVLADNGVEPPVRPEVDDSAVVDVGRG